MVNMVEIYSGMFITKMALRKYNRGEIAESKALLCLALKSLTHEQIQKILIGHAELIGNTEDGLRYHQVAK